MRLTLNHTNGTVVIDRKHYYTDTLKQFLISNYPELVAACYIRAIRSKNQTRFTYDWVEIFKRCERSILPLYDFIEKHQHQKTGEPAIRP